MCEHVPCGVKVCSRFPIHQALRWSTVLVPCLRDTVFSKASQASPVPHAWLCAACAPLGHILCKQIDHGCCQITLGIVESPCMPSLHPQRYTAYWSVCCTLSWHLYCCSSCGFQVYFVLQVPSSRGHCEVALE